MFYRHRPFLTNQKNVEGFVFYLGIIGILAMVIGCGIGLLAFSLVIAASKADK